MTHSRKRLLWYGLVPGMLVFMATLLLLFSPFIVRYFYGGYQSI